MCETKCDLLDMSVIDQVLLPLRCKEYHICPAYIPTEGQNSPYYKTQLDKLCNNFHESIEMIVLPLCDGSHFNGYVIDLKGKQIIRVDSLYPRKSGRRSVGRYLQETFFPGLTDVPFESFYKERIQFDQHTCGAWLVLGLVGYIIGIKVALPTFTQLLFFKLSYSLYPVIHTSRHQSIMLL